MTLEHVSMRADVCFDAATEGATGERQTSIPLFVVAKRMAGALRMIPRPNRWEVLLGASPSYSQARLCTCSRLRLGTRSSGWGPTQNGKRYPPAADQQQQRSQNREEVRKGRCEEWGVKGQEDPSPLG